MKNIEHSTFDIQHPVEPGRASHWMLVVGGWLLDVPKAVLIFAIRAYRWTISPAQVYLCGPNAGCRFTPSCSQYAAEAIQTHGAAAGTLLAAKRICRCHPWGACGHDPVPKAEPRSLNSEVSI